MQIDWKKKLTSRKFWIAVVGLVSGLLMAFNVNADTIETISGVIMSAASVIAYMIGEGLADSAMIYVEDREPIYGEEIEDD